MDMEWLRNQMEMRGLTQRELAAAVGMTDQMFSNVVAGRRRFSAAETDAIRRKFGYTLPEDRPAAISVAGRVGAGDHIELVDDFAKGAGLYQIVRPEAVSRMTTIAPAVTIHPITAALRLPTSAPTMIDTGNKIGSIVLAIMEPTNTSIPASLHHFSDGVRSARAINIEIR